MSAPLRERGERSEEWVCPRCSWVYRSPVTLRAMFHEHKGKDVEMKRMDGTK